MNITAILVIALVVIVLVFKFYNAFNTVKKKGITGFLKQKAIVLSVVAVAFGAFVLINPDTEVKNPKKVITEYIYQIID